MNDAVGIARTAVRSTIAIAAEGTRLLFHPARFALRAVGFARGVARAAASPRTVPAPAAPTSPPPESAQPPPAPVTVVEPAGLEPEPAQQGENFAHEPSPAGHADAHGGTTAVDLEDWVAELDTGEEVTTSAGTTGVAPEINPETGLPHHAPGD